MKFIRKMFGGEGKPGPRDEERDATTLEKTKGHNEPRRELIQLTLRETMRRHGIPTDWVDCRTLSVLTKQHKQGMHVQFLVRKADHQLLPWVHALQEGFWEQVLRADPRAHDWLFSVGWEFYGKSEQGFHKLPGADAWQAVPDTEPAAIDPREAGDTLPPEEADEVAQEEQELNSDLAALHELMTRPADLTPTPPAPPKR
jgi:hypothetical protein